MLTCELSGSADTSHPLSLRQTVTSRAALRIDRAPISMRNQSLAEGGNMAPILLRSVGPVSKIKFKPNCAAPHRSHKQRVGSSSLKLKSETYWRPMKVLSSIYLVIALLAANVTLLAQGQTQPSPNNREKVDSEKGITWFETFQGTINSDSRIYKIDSSVGWDFNKHFGVFVGAPVYFANLPSSTTTNGTATTTNASYTNSGIGNAYLGFTLKAPNTKLYYASAVTAYAPTGSAAKGFSTGRVGVDWTNRFEHTFSRLTPFFDGGLSNTVPDSAFLARPFTSLGAISHLEEGAEYQLARHFFAGGSGYQIVPFGSQKVFSRLNGEGEGENSFDTSTVSTGNDLPRENGYSTWVGLEPSSIVRFEVGYTRSITFDLNSFAFNLRLNPGRLLRPKRSY